MRGARTGPAGRPRKAATEGEQRLKDFGPRLRELREKRGLSQHELARAVSAHWTQISRYERGLQIPTADRVVSLARVLQVSLDGLLLGDRNGEDAVVLKNIRLLERFRALDDLPKEEQEIVVGLVDAVLAKHEFQNLAERMRRKTA